MVIFQKIFLTILWFQSNKICGYVCRCVHAPQAIFKSGKCGGLWFGFFTHEIIFTHFHREEPKPGIVMFLRFQPV
jgi:hypothetical protein